MNRNQKDINSLLVEVNKFSKKFVEDNYNIELILNFKQNNRLKRSLGRFIHSRRKIDLPIVGGLELSGQTLKYMSIEEIYGVVKHELIHYSLYCLDKPCDDKDTYFINECKKHNAPITGDYRLPIKHEYTCEKGCHIALSKKLSSRKKYVCTIHNSRLHYEGKFHENGERVA